MLKLNIGSFICMFKEWINIDILATAQMWAFAWRDGYQYCPLDVTTGIPFATDSVDYIFSSHMLEHIPYREGEKFLQECVRVLKPNGVMRIGVPDMELICKLYLERRGALINEINEPARHSKYDIEKFWGLLTADHYAMYDWDSLNQICRGAGFSDVTRHGFNSGGEVFMKETKDMYPEVSIYVEARK